MTPKQLKAIKDKLPKQYGKAIAKSLNTITISPQTVVKVFRGEITNPDIVIPVMDAAAQLLTKTKKVKSKLSKALKPA